MSPHDQPLPPALEGQKSSIHSAAGALSYYRSEPGTAGSSESAIPLLLVHSINAAGSGYEVRPIYERYRGQRPVYALDMPGFGFSERSDRAYTVRLMTDAIHAMVDVIRKNHGGVPIDALALSLSSEFLARAISERPQNFRTAALVSPTGFDSKAPYDDAPGTTRAKPWLYKFFRVPLWSKGMFKALTTRRGIRFFLEKTWGSKQIDEGLLDYDYLTTHQSGARFAPYAFIGGYLFSKDITRVYETLTLPVWMSHGDRGDFQDYRYAKEFKKRPNWTITKFSGGALMFFERPDEFFGHYDAFLARPVS